MTGMGVVCEDGRDSDGGSDRNSAVACCHGNDRQGRIISMRHLHMEGVG